MSTEPNTAHDAAIALAEEYRSTTNLNEADTRHRVIDTVLHDVLGWPKGAVRCEKSVSPGFADYVLNGRSQRPVLVIEAKREGNYFQLPRGFDSKGLAGTIRLKTLMTDDAIKEAVQQVRAYCLDLGCEYACITNGHQWVLFKVFEKEKDWRQLEARFIRSLDYFSVSFSEVQNNLGYCSVVEDLSLKSLLSARAFEVREVFHPRTKIPEYSQQVSSNRLAPVLRPLAKMYLRKLDEHDEEFMEECYVSIREYQHNQREVESLIFDCLSPYFVGYNVKDFFDDKKGGALGKRIGDAVRDRTTEEVIVLFGGKGAGKSTFIRRLLYHRPPNSIRHFAVVAVIDLLKCPPEKKKIEAEIWEQLLQRIDPDDLLAGEREKLLELFSDRFEVAKRQLLAGLPTDSLEYNLHLNRLVQEWLEDRAYCAKRLAHYWRRRQKGMIVVLDNTDQFSPDLQDYCFTEAQNIAGDLNCLVVISMREERFYHSRIHGTLDAFPGSGFHLSSPPPQSVFRKRLEYILKVLRDDERRMKVASGSSDEELEDLSSLLGVLIRDSRRSSSHLTKFLRASAHGNMRLALLLFENFLLSGYTQVDEMIKASSWNLQTHQVLRPMMVPGRFFYDEAQSYIPNLYRIRSQTGGSHFTGFRILEILSKNISPRDTVYHSLSGLIGHFVDTFDMLEDFEKHMDRFLKSGVVESDSRIDEYTQEIDSVRITPYGHYIANTMSRMFSYLDLTCLDCGVHDDTVAGDLAVLAKDDVRLFYKGKKMERIEARLSKVDLFIEYLSREEELEQNKYGLDHLEIGFSATLRRSFDKEKARILKSAARRYGTRRYKVTPQDYWE